MAIKNPQTWTRIRRSDIRQLANYIGNEALNILIKWPPSGEGRAIKAATESITRRLDGQQPLRDINLAFREITAATSELKLILDNNFFQSSLAMVMYRNKNDLAVPLEQHIRHVAADVDQYIREYNASLPPPPTAAEQAAAQIAEIVPDQKVGPARFVVAEGILRVEHQGASPNPADKKNVDAARQELVTSAEQIAAFLVESNQDSRLVATIDDMRDRLKSQQDVIQLGIAAIACQMVCDRFEDEMPDAWSAKLQAFAIGIGMYVAQFPEWLRFAENAAMAEYSASDVTRLFATGAKLVEELRAVGPTVDPEVPQTLAFLLEAVRDPRRARQRTVFAAIRAIENLIAAVIRSCGVVLGGLPEGMREGVKKGSTVVVASALLFISAQAAINIAPAAGRILQTNWLGKAGKLILESIKEAD